LAARVGLSVERALPAPTCPSPATKRAPVVVPRGCCPKPPGSGLQVRARAPPSPPRSGYACRTAPIDWARYGAYVTKPVTNVNTAETRNLVIMSASGAFDPLPLRETVASDAPARHEPGEGDLAFALRATPHPLRSLTLAQHPLPQGEREFTSVMAGLVPAIHVFGDAVRRAG
jgi:hypothetical protein